MVANNPAGRLHDILKRAMDVMALGEMSAWKGWSITFGITGQQSQQLSAENELDVVHALQELKKLVDITEERLRSLPDTDKEIFLEPFPQIRATLPPVSELNQSFRTSINNINSNTLTVLKFCSRELNKQPGDAELLNEELLSDVLGQAEELFAEVRASDVEGHLKKFILQQLEIIRQGINEYRINGAGRIEEALAQIIANFYAKGEIVKTAQNTEVVSRFREVLDKFVTLAKYGMTLKPLIGPAISVFKLLTSGDPEVPPPPMEG